MHICIWPYFNAHSRNPEVEGKKSTSKCWHSIILLFCNIGCRSDAWSIYITASFFFPLLFESRASVYRWSFGLLDRWCSHLPHLLWFKLWKFPLKEKRQQQQKIKKNNLSVALKSDASVKTKNAPGCCGGTSGIPGYWKHGPQPLPLVSQRRLCIWLFFLKKFFFFAESLFPTERWLDISYCHHSWVGPGGDHSSQDDKALKRTMRESASPRCVCVWGGRGGSSPRLKALKKNRRASRFPPSVSMYSPLPPAPRPDCPSHFFCLFVCFKIF